MTTRSASHSREARREDPASEELAELALDPRRHSVADLLGRLLYRPCLQMCPHALVKHGALGLATRRSHAGCTLDEMVRHGAMLTTEERSLTEGRPGDAGANPALRPLLSSLAYGRRKP